LTGGQADSRHQAAVTSYGLSKENSVCNRKAVLAPDTADARKIMDYQPNATIIPIGMFATAQPFCSRLWPERIHLELFGAVIDRNAG